MGGAWKRWGKCVLIFLYVMLWGLALLNNNPRVSYSMPEIFYKAPLVESNSSRFFTKDFCRLRWDDLHLHGLNIFAIPDVSSIEKRNPQVHQGGYWAPSDCIPFQRVAIVIPYRNRLPHLRMLLDRLHPMLYRQKVEYRIFVIEQGGSTPFNRGMLMNVGVNEALKHNQFDCFIFHDVDLLPEHDRNIYLCDEHTRHLASAIDEMRYHVMFYNYAGGVVALTKQNVFKENIKISVEISERSEFRCATKEMV